MKSCTAWEVQIIDHGDNFSPRFYANNLKFNLNSSSLIENRKRNKGSQIIKYCNSFLASREKQKTDFFSLPVEMVIFSVGFCCRLNLWNRLYLS